MKQNSVIRIFALLLVFVLCIGMLPQPSRALDLSAFEKFKEQAQQRKEQEKKSSGIVSGSWSDTKFWRSNRYTYPFEFDSVLNRCTGFTLDYEIVEVEKGSLSGKFKFEIYVRNTSGNWKSVGTFYLDGYEASTKVTFDSPMSIDAVAVVCLKQGSGVTYTHTMTIRNATYKSSTQKDSGSGKGSGSATTPSSGRVSGSWSDEKFIRNGRTTYPFEFTTPIKKCTGFTVNYAITEVNSGNLDGNFKFAVYVHNTSGNWKYAKEFQMKGDSTSVKVTFSPMTVDAVAVICLKNGNYSYSYTMSITNPKTK